MIVKEYEVSARINQRAYKDKEIELDSDVYDPPARMPYGVAIINSTIGFMITRYAVDLYTGKLIITLYNPSPIPQEKTGKITVVFFV